MYVIIYNNIWLNRTNGGGCCWSRDQLRTRNSRDRNRRVVSVPPASFTHNKNIIITPRVYHPLAILAAAAADYLAESSLRRVYNIPFDGLDPCQNGTFYSTVSNYS